MKGTLRLRLSLANRGLIFCLALGFVVVVFGLQGCSPSRSYLEGRRLPEDVPSAWASRVPGSKLPITGSLLTAIADKGVELLVREALANNYDLKAAALRLKAEGLLLSAPRARLVPRLEAEFSKGRNNQVVDTGTGEREAGDTHRVALGLSWEVDIWGRLADERKATQYEFFASEHELIRARDALAARVIQAWIEQVVSRKNMDLAQKRLSLLQGIERIVKDRFAGGIGVVEELSIARSRTELARAEVAQTRATWRQSIRQLEVLLGRYPRNELLAGSDIPLIPVASEKTPLTVLLDRPDIRAALAKVESSTRAASAAQKAMLPNATLSAQVFRQSAVLGSLGGATTYWSLLGSLLQPLFEGGRIIQEARARRLQSQAVLMDLHQAVLQAMKEVEDALDLEQHLVSERESLESALHHAQDNRVLLEQRYRRGLATLHELLVASEQEIDINMRLNETIGRQMVNRVELMLALGIGVQENVQAKVALGGVHGKQ